MSDSQATASEGAIIKIGTLNAKTVADADDVFIDVGEVVSFSDLDGGSSAEIDVSHLLSEAKEYLLGLLDSGTFSMELNYIFGDAGQAEARAARRSRQKRNFQVILPNDESTTLKFKGFVQSAPLSGGVDQKLASTMTVRVSGLVTEE